MRPVCDQLARESAANNMTRMREADEAIIQLVKDCISKWTTTMNKQLQVVAKGRLHLHWASQESPLRRRLFPRSY